MPRFCVPLPLLPELLLAERCPGAVVKLLTSASLPLRSSAENMPEPPILAWNSARSLAPASENCPFDTACVVPNTNDGEDGERLLLAGEAGNEPGISGSGDGVAMASRTSGGAVGSNTGIAG